MSKLKKIETDIERTRKKISTLNTKLKNLEQQKIEEINMQIVAIVRAENMTPNELKEFLKNKKTNPNNFIFTQESEEI